MPPQQAYPQPSYPTPPPPGPSASEARKHHSWGLIISLVLFVLLFLGAAGFAVVTYGQKETYRTQTQKIVDEEVQTAVDKAKSQKDAEFVEKEKNPLKKYDGPATFGSLDISYPKTWSAFVTQSDRSAKPIEGYFHPGVVPGIQSGTAFALRIEVSNRTYEQEMKQFDAKVKAGTLKVTAFAAKNVPTVRGSRVEGEIFKGQQDSMIVLPLRDKTIKIWTESQQFIGDFNSIILENLKFVP